MEERIKKNIFRCDLLFLCLAFYTLKHDFGLSKSHFFTKYLESSIFCKCGNQFNIIIFNSGLGFEPVQCKVGRCKPLGSEKESAKNITPTLTLNHVIKKKQCEKSVL